MCIRDSNDLGIPLLDANMQAQTVTAPVLAWGAKVSRKQQNAGLWHFYTEDYRFEALWIDPTPVVNSGCQSVVEPNYSAYTEMPRIVALWSIYRKRWLARWCARRPRWAWVPRGAALRWRGAPVPGAG